MLLFDERSVRWELSNREREDIISVRKIINDLCNVESLDRTIQEELGVWFPDANEVLSTILEYDTHGFKVES